MLRVLLAIVVLSIVFVALLPTALTGFAQRRLGDELTRELGTECRIGGLTVGWLSGAALRELEVANPPGFDASHPLLRLELAAVDLSLWKLMTGRVDCRAELRGLQLWIDQDDDGATNLDRVLGTEVRAGGGGRERPRSPRSPRDSRTPDADVERLLGRLAIDATIRDGAIEIRRAGRLLERVTDIEFAVAKLPDTGTFGVHLSATLPQPDAGPAGAVLANVDVDGVTGRADGTLRAQHLHLERYAPLAQSLLAPDALTAMAGTVDGLLEFGYDPTAQPRLRTDGDLTVTAPHFAGALLRGMELRAERWVLRPGIAWTGDGDDRTVDLGATHLDLGFAQLDGLGPEQRAERGLGDQLAAAFTLDLAALARLGGPLAELDGASGQVTGTVALPAALLTGDPSAALALLRELRGIAVDARIAGAGYRGGGLTLADAAATLTLRDGTAELKAAPSTLLNQGPLQIELRSDVAAAGMPFALDANWNGAQVRGDAAPFLRYAVPLLAGLDGDAGAFSSTLDLRMSLRGPTRKGDDQSWLQWLNAFEGGGELTLTGGDLRPAPALTELLELLGQKQSLALDGLAGAFSIHQGSVTTQATKLLSKGQEYGLSGKVGFDGAIDAGLNVTALLQQHRDGRVIAGFLGDEPLLAGLGGTVDAPTLRAPDLGQLLQQALQQAPRQLLEQQGKDLLQQGLDKLFGKPKDRGR
ncbi:MAG: hypothetical protein AB7O97_03650 [Planctomycetota bacterium]